MNINQLFYQRVIACMLTYLVAFVYNQIVILTIALCKVPCTEYVLLSLIFQ